MSDRLRVHERPALPRIVGSIEPAARLGFDERIDAVGPGGGDREVSLADQFRGQPRHVARERLAAVRALVESAFPGTADDGPRLALEPRHPRVDDVRVGRVDLDVHRADLVRDVEHLLPGLSAVHRLEHAALGVRFERVAHRRHPDDVGVGGVDAHRADLAGVVEAGECPGRAAIGRLVDAAPGRHVAPDAVRSGAEIDDVRVGVRHADAAGRTERDLAVGDGRPGGSGVGRAEHSAAGDAHVERPGLRRHAGHRGDPPAPRRTDQAVSKSREERRIDARHPGHHGPGSDASRTGCGLGHRGPRGRRCLCAGTGESRDARDENDTGDGQSTKHERPPEHERKARQSHSRRVRV